MADLGTLQTLVNRLPTELRPAMLEIVKELVKMRLGHPTGDAVKDPMINLQGAFLHGTSPATPGDSFTLAHNFGRTPYLAWRVLLLDTVGSTDGTLTVSRAADEKRIYLESVETSAPVSLAVEG